MSSKQACGCLVAIAIIFNGVNICKSDGMIFTTYDRSGKLIKYMENVTLTACVIRCTNLDSYASFMERNGTGRCSCVKLSDTPGSTIFAIYRPMTGIIYNILPNSYHIRKDFSTNIKHHVKAEQYH